MASLWGPAVHERHTSAPTRYEWRECHTHITLILHCHNTFTHTHTHTLHSLLHLPKSPSLTLGNSGEIPHFAHTPRHTTLSQHTDTTLTAQPNHPHTTLQLGLGWQKYRHRPTTASVLLYLFASLGLAVAACVHTPKTFYKWNIKSQT